MKKVFIYPTYTPNRDKSGNLYIKYFHNAFQQNSNWKLDNKGWKLGITSILFNLNCNIFIIHWVDLIPYKKFGKIQFIIFILCIFLLKLLRKQIIWVLHNKHAHRGKSRIVNACMSLMSTFADIVVTHSQEGVTFFDNKFPKQKGKCFYIPHPVYTTETFKGNEIKWDYIIWGNINKRKKIVDFLQYANSCTFFKNKKILICGKCNDKEYDQQIQSECKPNITYINKFIQEQELKEYICHSQIILFTYNTDSILSSGALIYSLNFYKPIIGPKAGSFVDLEGIVSCYDTFKDIPHINNHCSKSLIKTYIEENTWEKFPNKLSSIINNLQKK